MKLNEGIELIDKLQLFLQLKPLFTRAIFHNSYRAGIFDIFLENILDI